VDGAGGHAYTVMKVIAIKNTRLNKIKTIILIVRFVDLNECSFLTQINLKKINLTPEEDSSLKANGAQATKGSICE
jgi:hypothetical protein